MLKKSYLPTDLAGTHVAGKRIRDRKTPILLTDSQAEHELRQGTITPFVEEPVPAPKPKDKKAD